MKLRIQISDLSEVTSYRSNESSIVSSRLYRCLPLYRKLMQENGDTVTRMGLDLLKCSENGRPLQSSKCKTRVSIPGSNRPFSYSEKESQSNDTLLHLVDFSNVRNSDRSSNATRSNLMYKNV